MTDERDYIRLSPWPWLFKHLHKLLVVDFAAGKRVHIYTAPDYNCDTIDLDDQTTLNLAIELGFLINPELQHINKGNIELIAEWPEIPSQR